VPLIGIVHGRCFAGNAALLGCCDLIIATPSASIGLGGPAMIEGGGLGKVAPEEVGPVSVQAPNGVIDLLVQDEAEAVAAARQVLACLLESRETASHGPREPAQAPSPQPGGDQASLRHAIPPQRHALYDVRAILRTVVDAGSLIELRPAFGLGRWRGSTVVRWRWWPVPSGTWGVRWMRRPATSWRAFFSWPTPTACRW
jgi:acetyl-CoA carboxylase carboxyltransferase component